MLLPPQEEEMKATDLHLQKFERFDKPGAAQTPSWLFPLRKAAMARFAELGFPTLDDEDWRFTNVQPIAKLPFQPAFEPTLAGVDRKDLSRFTFASLPGHKLVFVNGHYAAGLSSLGKLEPGLTIMSLREALLSDSPLVQKHLGQYHRADANSFAALNTAFFQDGAVVAVPAGMIVERPVHLLFITTGGEAGATSHLRNLVLAGDRSQLTLIESYAALEDSSYVTNAVTEFVVGDRAVVEHCKFQDEALTAFHVSGLHAQIGAGANFLSHSIVTGAQLSRNNIRTVLGGPGIEAILNGLYVTQGDQLADHHMVVDHAQPHCASHEYFNGILEGHSRGVFHGRILVRKGAQKTDAKQTNKNLLLSDDATVDTKPQLEIYADDVKCTHGATIGQLNEESIFYLRSRGIGAETARRMLIHAFAGEIIDRIRCQPVREELDRVIWERLEQNEHVAVKND